jgi:hypothetical protein
MIFDLALPGFILDPWFELYVLDSIKMYLREERPDDVDWCYLPEDRIYLYTVVMTAGNL